MRTVTWTAGSNAPPVSPAEEPLLYLALDGSAPRAGTLCVRLINLDELSIGRGSARGLRAGTDHGVRLDVPDSWLSENHFAIEKRGHSYVAIDRGSKNGTFANGKGLQSHTLEDGDLIHAGAHLFLFRRAPVAPETSALPSPLRTHVAHLADRFLELARAARSNIPILVGGETGTGKEVMARHIHELSARSGPFVALNCGALPKNILEAELFGAKKGAFSGAEADRPGLVRTADRGTLFLDEIAELPLESQATLLRVLQEREVLPLGSNKPVPVDLRVVAATHQDLDALCERGTFRNDLYARLLGFDLELPPLRDRTEDIGDLIAALWPNDATPTRLHPEAARALLSYDWPLNIRELERALQTAAAVASGTMIELKHLPAAVQGGLKERARATPGPAISSAAELAALVAQHEGNISAIARALSTSRSQVRRLLRRHGLDTDKPG